MVRGGDGVRGGECECEESMRVRGGEGCEGRRVRVRRGEGCEGRVRGI